MIKTHFAETGDVFRDARSTKEMLELSGRPPIRRVKGVIDNLSV
jgi:hypothetical protein